MRFSARGAGRGGGRRNAHPRPSYRSLRRAQPISFLQPASNCYVVDRFRLHQNQHQVKNLNQTPESTPPQLNDFQVTVV